MDKGAKPRNLARVSFAVRPRGGAVEPLLQSRGSCGEDFASSHAGQPLPPQMPSGLRQMFYTPRKADNVPSNIGFIVQSGEMANNRHIHPPDVVVVGSAF